MDSKTIILITTVIGGFALAWFCDVFSKKSKFAKEHSTLNFFAGLILVAGAVYLSILFNHINGSWLLPMIGFFVFAKINESRDKRQRVRARRQACLAKVDAAIAARVEDEAVEIDFTGVGDDTLWYVVEVYKKKGLKVELVKNLTSGGSSLRLSKISL